MGGGVRLIDDTEILNEMLKPGVLIPVPSSHSRAAVSLTDTISKTTVEIKGIPRGSVIINADFFQSPDSVFQGSKGECKRADFVIVANESKKWIIFIETQTGNYKERTEVIAQLRGALCFVNYCKCIGKQFWLDEEFLDGYEYRFVSMAHTSVHKRRTRNIHRSTSHTRPERFLKLPGKSHHFSALI